MLLKEKAKVHFIGIGGIGMSGIAEVLLNLGYRVSGSDQAEGKNVIKLKKLGAQISIGHAAENIDSPTVVVYSSAIDSNNPEVLETLKNNIPLIKRAEMLSELMRDKFGVAIAGSHGKTTTTSMLATILHEAKMDPTHIIGGIVSNLSGHAKVGKSKYLIAEADESDGSFLMLNPILSTITNIDNDHLDFYKTSENLEAAFVKFANRIPFYGFCTLNANDPTIQKIKGKIKRPWKSFGISDSDNYEIHYQARNVEESNLGSEFDLFYMNTKVERIKISLPGKHNVLNALSAISLAHLLGMEFKSIKESIEPFEGVDRRFQSLYKTDIFEIIDDYGHHPTEIQNTVETALKIKGNRKVWAIFEPHRFSRTSLCWKEFITCFEGVDKLSLLPIYAASEEPMDGISSSNLAKKISDKKYCEVEELLSPHEMELKIKEAKEKDVLVLTLGAGSIGKNIRDIVNSL